NDRGEPRGSQASRSSTPPKILPIETPAISLDELKRLTSNFGTKTLVGEGSYGRVFSATLSTSESAAVKKLDPGRKGVQGATPGPVLSWNQKVNLSHHFSHVKSLIHVECNLLTSLGFLLFFCLVISYVLSFAY
ncbi:hypothetical protein IFM89_009596, partial [Coptis chinensis]